VLLDFQLSEEQATKLADWLLQVVLPPDVIRQLIVDFLTDRTIQLIDEGFQKSEWYLLRLSVWSTHPHSPGRFVWMKERQRMLVLRS